ELLLELRGEHRLAQLPGVAHAAQIGDVPRVLLGDRRTTLAGTAGEVVPRRASDADEVNAAVLEEVLVLRGDHRMPDVRIDLVPRDDRAVLLAELGELLPIAVRDDRRHRLVEVRRRLHRGREPGEADDAGADHHDHHRERGDQQIETLPPLRSLRIRSALAATGAAPATAGAPAAGTLRASRTAAPGRRPRSGRPGGTDARARHRGASADARPARGPRPADPGRADRCPSGSGLTLARHDIVHRLGGRGDRRPTNRRSARGRGADRGGSDRRRTDGGTATGRRGPRYLLAAPRQPCVGWTRTWCPGIGFRARP